MAAVIQLRPDVQRSIDLADRVAETATPRHGRSVPGLRVLHGGRSLQARRLRRTFLLRRLAVVVGVVLAGWLMAQLLAAATTPLGASPSPSSSPVVATQVVQPGQTLWGLAGAVDADADPRDVVDRIVALNDPGAPGSALSADLELLAGRELHLPVGG